MEQQYRHHLDQEGILVDYLVVQGIIQNKCYLLICFFFILLYISSKLEREKKKRGRGDKLF